MDRDGILNLFALLGDPRTRVLGANIIGPCPFAAYSSAHKNPVDGTPGFSVKVEPDGDSLAYCYTCKVGGPLARLMRRLNDKAGGAFAHVVAFVESGEEVPLEAVIARMQRKQEESANGKQPSKTRWGMEGLAAFVRASARRPPLEYLKGRGLTESQISGWQLGTDVLAGDRVTIPVFGAATYGHAAPVVGLQGRALRSEVQPKYRFYNREFPFDPNTLVYGEHLIDRAWSYIMLVEGPFDVIRVVSLGFRNVVCCFGTGEISGVRLRKFAEWDLPVILLMDRDRAGIEATTKVAASLDGAVPAAYAAFLPDVCTDPSDADAGMIEWAIRRKTLFVG